MHLQMEHPGKLVVILIAEYYVVVLGVSTPNCVAAPAVAGMSQTAG
jgi:hypothetical protein